jgi:hypothetical protein
VRFSGDWRESNFEWVAEDSTRGAAIGGDRYFEDYLFDIYFQDGSSCLTPPWLTNPPDWITF